MRCRSPAATISSSTTPKTGLSATSCAKALTAFREGPPNLACLQAKLNLYNADRQLAHAPVHHRIWRAVRRAAAGARPPAPADPARRHLKSFPRRGAEMADGLGPLQRHRGCRSRHAARADRLSLPSALAPPPSRRRRSSSSPGSASARAGSRATCRPGSCICGSLRKLWRELGPAGFLGFQVMVGGTVLSALVHPWFYALAVFDLANHAFLEQPALAWAPGLAHRLAQPWGRLSCLDGGLAFLALKQRGARQLFSKCR